MSFDPTPARLAAIRDRDPETIRVLLARYGPMLWGLCRSLDPQPEDAYPSAPSSRRTAAPRRARSERRGLGPVRDWRSAGAARARMHTMDGYDLRYVLAVARQGSLARGGSGNPEPNMEDR